MKRCFIAIDVSDEARTVVAEHLASLKRGFRDARVSWTKPENLHITLKFLGDVDDDVLQSLIEQLSGLQNFEPFMLALGHPECFGKRVLAIAVNDTNGGLAALQDSVERICLRLGFERENRVFRPHITIGRIREQKGTTPLIAAHKTSRIKSVRFGVDSVVLYESKLGPGGSVYRRVT